MIFNPGSKKVSELASKLKGGILFVLLSALTGYTVPASAVLTIEVNQGVSSGIPIAIVPFALRGLGKNTTQPAEIIGSDLELSGRFESIPRSSFLSSPHDLKSVLFKDWRLIKAEALVVGQVINLGNGQYEVRFRLIDVFREKQLSGQKFIVTESKVRSVSHQISDIIYKKLTGMAGAFDTKIAYITVQGETSNPKYLLRVADSDGWGAKTILESDQPILSPDWSPDGRRLAYVSFEKKRSIIFVQDVWRGERTLITEFPGINSAPAWSPDGRKLALTLSKEGNPEIYVYDLSTAELKQLTRHTAIDTEPAWSPDGRTLVFTSNRSGGPQIFEMPSTGGTARRLTFKGDYNAGASYSPDGSSLVLISNQGNGYKVAIYSRGERSIRQLTRSTQDESPSFAPNGGLVIYATQKNGRNILATVSIDGNIQQTIKFQDGAVREPAWSPFNQ